MHLSLSNRIPGPVPTLFEKRSSCKNVFLFHQRLNPSCLRGEKSSLPLWLCALFTPPPPQHPSLSSFFSFFLMTTQECFMFDKMRQGHRLLLSSSKASWLCREMNADAHRSQSVKSDSCLERSKRNRSCLHMICSSFGRATSLCDTVTLEAKMIFSDRFDQRRFQMGVD